MLSVAYNQSFFPLLHMLMKIHKTRNNLSQVIYRNGRRGLSPWATNKFGRDLLVALNTLHKVAFLSFDQKQQWEWWCVITIWNTSSLLIFSSHMYNLWIPPTKTINITIAKFPNTIVISFFQRHQKEQKRSKLYIKPIIPTFLTQTLL